MRVVRVSDSSVSISDLLGGALVDDPVTWVAAGVGMISVYLAEDRAGAPDNPVLSVIATRLGTVDRAFHATARGPALLLGSMPCGTDRDLPALAMAEVACSGVPVELPAPVSSGAGHAAR